MARRKLLPEEVADDQIKCKSRVYGHAWFDFIDGEMAPPHFGYRLSLRCERCAAERHDVIDSLGRVGSRHYVYAEGYRDAEVRGVPRADYRLELAKRYGVKSTRRTNGNA